MAMKIYITIGILLTCFLSCKRDDEVYSLGNKKGAGINEIISFGTISNPDPEADTTTISLINVQINPEADSANRSVTFNTSLGFFTNGKNTITVTTDAYGRAQAAIKSSTAGAAMISAAIKAATIDTLIHFIPALPDDILLSADNYSVDTAQTITLMAGLFRNPGRGVPTDPVKIWFTITPNTLVYPEFVNSTAHVGTIAIKNPFNATGTFKVEAKTLGASGDTIMRSINVIVK
jgi:hypothetical protein